jgi:hypothetical protein
MLSIFNSLLWSLHVWFRGKAKIQLEIIALHHQLAITHRQNPKPKLTRKFHRRKRSGRVSSTGCGEFAA